MRSTKTPSNFVEYPQSCTGSIAEVIVALIVFQVPAIAGVADQRFVAAGRSCRSSAATIEKRDRRRSFCASLMVAGQVSPYRRPASIVDLGLVVGLLAALLHRQRQRTVRNPRAPIHAPACRQRSRTPKMYWRAAAPSSSGHGLGTDHAAVGDDAHARNIEAPAHASRTGHENAPATKAKSLTGMSWRKTRKPATLALGKPPLIRRATGPSRFFGVRKQSLCYHFATQRLVATAQAKAASRGQRHPPVPWTAASGSSVRPTVACPSV